MSRPLSDDERRSINVNKIDDALAAFASTPIDELDADKWMADLDDALTPGHTRRPLEVPDEPVVRTPKRSMHHEVGGDDDADEDVQHLPTWDDDDVVGDTQSTVDDDARVDVGAPNPMTQPRHPHPKIPALTRSLQRIRFRTTTCRRSPRPWIETQSRLIPVFS
ncbi:hypothetical protein GCM10020255_026320 [Rhodococcus baikonurensis]